MPCFGNHLAVFAVFWTLKGVPSEVKEDRVGKRILPVVFFYDVYVVIQDIVLKFNPETFQKFI